MSTNDSRGSIAAYVPGFWEELSSTGYARLTIRGLVRGVRHLGTWADGAGISTADFDERVLAAFLEHLTRCRCDWRSKGKFRPARVAARLFLAHLRRVGVVPPAAEAARATSKLLAEFRAWMQTHRGLSPATLAGYVRALESFLEAMGDDPSRFRATDVRAYVLQCTRRQSRARVKWTVNAIRALLRFLVAEGRVSSALIVAAQLR